MAASAVDVIRFPDRSWCPILETASPQVCLRCAAPRLRPITPPTCPTCAQHLDLGGSCPNEAVCRRPDRALVRLDALAALEGDLESRLRALKYGRDTRWALVLGRLLAVVLARSRRDGGGAPAAPLGGPSGTPAAPPGGPSPPPAASERPELVVANPTWTGPPAHHVPHVELLTAVAMAGCPPSGLQLPPVPVVAKLGPSPRSAETSAGGREAAARAHVGACVVRPDADLRGRRVVLVDDVCTSGWQLEAMAELLRAAGAREVRGVVLARTPWRGPPPVSARARAERSAWPAGP